MTIREETERWERESLAPYALLSAASRGRDHPVGPDPMRTDFQRDRDRVIHSTAFRRLEYKTQVFIIHEGDYYRTRLTHTIEVAQLARTLAQALRLNIDLAEAIALSHDLGHTPFGHAGENAMKRMMDDAGGFEHNLQGLRVVERLEERYPAFPGLNLTYELREGLVKHDTTYDRPTTDGRFHPEESPTLESQIVDIVDSIAYNNADLDDALEMGLIEEGDLRSVDWVWDLFVQARKECGASARAKFVKYRAIAAMYDLHMRDAIEETRRRIEEASIRSLDDVRRCRARLADYSAAFKGRLEPLQKFLFKRVYRHPAIVCMATKSEKFIEEMFQLYLDHPNQLPWKYQERIDADGLKRVIADYLSGMTDRYLMEEYKKAFTPQFLV